MNPELTRERLLQLLHYDEGTGVFTRRCALPGYRVGSVAGTVVDRGYIVIKIDGKSHKAHRLAWLYAKEKWPDEHIDHQDGDTGNNRLSNLREATRAQNLANCKLYKSSKSKLKGVCWHRATGKWCSYIQANRKRVHLGLFDDPGDAHQRFLKAAAELHREFARAA